MLAAVIGQVFVAIHAVFATNSAFARATAVTAVALDRFSHIVSSSRVKHMLIGSCLTLCVQFVPCRLELALTGKCNEQCEDQLQHVISVHLRTRYLASELNEDEVSANMVNYEGSPDHKPAAYLHHSFQRLWTRYNHARSKRSWFNVQLPDQPLPK